MAKVTRKQVVSTLLNSTDARAYLRAAMGTDITDDTLTAMLGKWDSALNKPVKSTKGKDDEYVINTIVPYVLAQDGVVTAKQVDAEFIHGKRPIKAAALLRRGCELGLLSRDKVRKNSSYIYAGPDFNWDEYVTAYNEEMAERAAERVRKASEARHSN